MNKQDADELLDEARELLEAIEAKLPSRIQPRGGETPESNHYRIDSQRQFLAYRICDLSKAGIALLAEEHVVPGLLLVRAMVETSAVLSVLHGQTEDAIEAGELSRVDEQVMKMLLGGRTVDTGYTSTNILTFIDKVSKDYDGFRVAYDHLCEFSHPNWSGCMGSYSRFVPNSAALDLGPLTMEDRERGHPFRLALGLLSAGLMIAQDSYEGLGKLLSKQ